MRRRDSLRARRAAVRRARWLPIAAVTLGGGLQRGLGALLIVALLAIANRDIGLGAAETIGVAAALALVGGAVADFGTTLATLRDFAVAPPSRRDFVEVVRLKILLGVAGTGVLALGGLAFAPGEWAAAITIAALSIPVSAVTSSATSKLIADGDGTSLGIGAAFAFVVGGLVAFGLSLVTDSAWALLLALPLARAVEAVLLVTACVFPTLADTRSHYDIQWLRRAWPLSTYWVLQVAYLRGQVIIPSLVLAASEGGAVANGFNLYSAGTLLPGAFALAAWPQISRAVGRSLDDGLREVVRLSVLSFLMVLPGCALLFIVPGRLLEVIYGDSSASLEAYMRWSAVAVLFVGPNALMLSLLVVLRSNATVAFLWLVSFAGSAVLLLVGPVVWGIAGAGVAVAAAQVLVFALLAASLRRVATIGYVLGGAYAAPGGSRDAARGAIAAALALAGATALGSSAPFITQQFAFPDARTGLLVLLAGPVVVYLVIRAVHYDLLAPASLFALTWTTALGISQVPLYPQFTWTREMWALVTIAPGVMAATMVVATGEVARLPRRPPGELLGRWRSPKGLIALFVAIGLFAWARYYASIGTIPLLSGNIDAVRFSEFDLVTLVGTRMGQAALIAALFFGVLSRTMRDRVFYGVLVAVTALPIFLSGGRLYLISAVVSAGVAMLMVRPAGRKMVTWMGVAGVAIIVAASITWFARIDQQAPNPFRNYLRGELQESRPSYLEWTIPVQIAGSASLNTLADLVETKAFKDHDHDGPYSLHFLDRFVPSADLQDVTRVTARFNQVTSTYLGEFYADFGMLGAVIASFFLGLAYSLLYRLARARGSPAFILVYAYASFWILFSAYLGYWTTHGVWLADVPLLALVGFVAGRQPVQRQLPVAGIAPVTEPEPAL